MSDINSSIHILSDDDIFVRRNQDNNILLICGYNGSVCGEDGKMEELFTKLDNVLHDETETNAELRNRLLEKEIECEKLQEDIDELKDYICELQGR